MKKYEKFSKEDYLSWYQQNQLYRDQVASDPNRLHYHLMPETGWLNDPNGLCQFHGTYHIYYQYSPFEPNGELKSWGHYTTKDFLHYQNEVPVLYPDSDMDAHGVYSGSAFLEDDEIHFFYTGNVKYFDRDDYDYITSGRGSNTIHVESKDGFSFSKKELLMTTDDYPNDISCHVRDPKIYKTNNWYYMVLGARDLQSHGLVLIYRSSDLKSWSYYDRLTTEKPFGYMWECPDLFELDGQLFLICCPQGVPTHGIEYENIHQCTWMKVHYDKNTEKFSLIEEPHIPMLDRGFDFYAPQSFNDEQGRRILIGWMGIPEANYTNPTVEQGWQHALTLPRQLHYKNGKLIQWPLQELEQLREHPRTYSFDSPNLSSEKSIVCECSIQFQECESFTLTLRNGVTLSYNKIDTLDDTNPLKQKAKQSFSADTPYLLTLDLGSHGSGRTTRSVALSSLNTLRIYSDTSSLEIFVNDGEDVFTTRVYGLEGQWNISGNCSGTLTLYDMKHFQIKKN